MKLKTTCKVAGVVLLLAAGRLAMSQPLITQHSFTNTPDGANPLKLVLANGVFFGSTAYGGTNSDGTIFTFNPNSSATTILYNFKGDSTDGISPNNVVVGGNRIFGTTQTGGTNNFGMIFSVGTNGTGFTSLYSFGGNPDGENPRGNLILSGGVLYGITVVGGVGVGLASGGTVFKINTNGTGYATLHSFTNNPDGIEPQGDLILSGNTLYGTTTFGGASGRGIVFSINTDGSGYTILHSFTNAPEPNNPYGGLVVSGGILYGTGSGGGDNTTGAIFAMSTNNGAGFRVLYSFSGFAGNLDGAIPKASLASAGNSLYGTTVSGGIGNGGTIFILNTNGTGFAVIGSFTNGAVAGSDPLNGVMRVGSAIWGATYQDGVNNGGTIFDIPLPAITSAPQSLTVANGSPVVFRVTAADDLAITYQWYFNTNTLLAGQTNSTLTFAGATNNLAGTYTVVVSDGVGSVTSSPAALVVFAKPTITLQPQDITVTNGNPVSFASAATGDGPLVFQWFFQTNTMVAGGANPALTFTNAVSSLAGYYSVLVTNAFGSATSRYALLRVSNQLNLLSFALSRASGSAVFVLANGPNSTNRLWASTNLTSSNYWQVIATNVMDTNGLWFFTDANTAKTNSLRFYRFSTP